MSHPLLPSYKDVFGHGVDEPINAIAYELSRGGDLVRGKPDLWAALESHVYMATRNYMDTLHLDRRDIHMKLAIWLEWNEKKGEK